MSSIVQYNREDAKITKTAAKEFKNKLDRRDAEHAEKCNICHR